MTVFDANHKTATPAVYRCAWLLNPGEPPRQNVRLSVLNDVIAEICDVPPDERSLISPVAILPQFVNVHTHLEFSSIQEPLTPANPFTEWIRAVMTFRRSQPDLDRSVMTAVNSGLNESRTHHVAGIGEITTSNIGRRALLESMDNLSVVSFRELIGFTSDRIAPQLQLAQLHLNNSQPDDQFVETPSNFIAGLSPHAPYSVHPELFEAAVDLASASNTPIAMHLAETQAELELLSCQSGDFVTFLQCLGLWDATVLKLGTTPLRYLQKLAQSQHALAVHGNYFSNAEIQFLGRNPHIATVYCPRTHRYFQHSVHPWRKLLAAGATVVLGTDSRASNPDLSIWKELQDVAQQPDAPPLWELLPMITTDAAKAIGLNSSSFRIQEGNVFRWNALRCECDSVAQLQHHLPRAEGVQV